MKKLPQQIFSYTPVILLVLIALVQQYYAHVKDLSPWKGGGFGMFSTYDSPGARSLQAFLVTEKDTLPVRIPGKYKKLLVRTRTLPTEKGLQTIAGNLLAEEWVDYGNISYTGRSREENTGGGFTDEDLRSISSEDPRASDGSGEFIARGSTVRYVDIKKGKKAVFSEARDLVPVGMILVLWKLEFNSEKPVIRKNKFLETYVSAASKKE